MSHKKCVTLVNVVCNFVLHKVYQYITSVNLRIVHCWNIFMVHVNHEHEKVFATSIIRWWKITVTLHMALEQRGSR